MLHFGARRSPWCYALRLAAPSRRGAICARSLVSKLTDSLRSDYVASGSHGRFQTRALGALCWWTMLNQNRTLCINLIVLVFLVIYRIKPMLQVTSRNDFLSFKIVFSENYLCQQEAGDINHNWNYYLKDRRKENCKYCQYRYYSYFCQSMYAK